MTRYVLDSNLYLDADRVVEKGRELADFYARHLPFTFLHATVAQEFLTGGRDRAARSRIHIDIIRPFERRERLVIPTWNAWKRAGEVLAELSARGALSLHDLKPSFLNDVQIATSCRESGMTLVTRNRSDFDRIRSVLPFDVVSAWP